MYIIGSQVGDDEIAKLTEEIKKFITDAGGTVDKHEDMGKRKLAYPIKKTRNGNYVLVEFSAQAAKLETIEHRLRTTLPIVRHLLVNMDEALARQEKDRIRQSQMKPRRPADAGVPEEAARPASHHPPLKTTQPEKKKMTIDLDAEIEKAIGSEDIK